MKKISNRKSDHFQSHGLFVSIKRVVEEATKEPEDDESPFTAGLIIFLVYDSILYLFIPIYTIMKKYKKYFKPSLQKGGCLLKFWVIVQFMLMLLFMSGLLAAIAALVIGLGIAFGILGVLLKLMHHYCFGAGKIGECKCSDSEFN